MLQHLQAMEVRIRRLEAAIKDFVGNSALCRKITVVKGVGPLNATAIVGAIRDAKQRSNGRHLAEWLGLVPRQYFSGEKPGCRASASEAIRIANTADPWCKNRYAMRIGQD